MSKQPSQPNKHHHKQLTKIRLHLEEHNTPPSLQDEEILAMVISDANKGIDITQEYSAFYEKLLHNAHLRQLFLEALEIADDPAEVNSPTGTPSPSLLQQVTQIIWQRTAEQLQTIFAPPPAAQLSRADTADTADETFTLLTTEANIEQTPVKLTLTAVHPLDDEEHLHLYLFVESISLHLFQASLTWGSYQETLSLPANTPTLWPPLPLNAVFNEDTQTFVTGLDLSLEPILPPL